MTDTLVKCTVCGREEHPSFAGSLRNGWPKCCGYTMRLLRTDADIAASVITAQEADFAATVAGVTEQFPSPVALDESQHSSGEAS
jgi:hypothetical protein